MHTPAQKATTTTNMDVFCRQRVNKNGNARQFSQNDVCVDEAHRIFGSFSVNVFTTTYF
jgi:hypothetical protein